MISKFNKWFLLGYQDKRLKYGYKIVNPSKHTYQYLRLAKIGQELLKEEMKKPIVILKRTCELVESF